MSEQTGEVLDANAARVWKCLTACEGMVNPVAEIARLRDDLREALDALEELYKVAAPNSYPLTVFNAAVKATEGAQTILRKHGRAV